MATDKLYDLAFAYKREKLCKKLYESDIFAVRLPDGETGYCCVLGFLGEHNALALYIGAAGFQSYRTLVEERNSFFADDSFMIYQDMLMTQRCLQCAFENKDSLSPEELEEVRYYAKSRRIPLRGANAFPQFVRYVPGRLPWPIEDEESEAQIGEALSAAVALAQMLAKRGKQALGFRDEDLEDKKTIPYLVRERGGFALKSTRLPPAQLESFPVPPPPDQETVSQIRGLKKSGILECEIIQVPEPVQDEDGGAPWFPSLLLCVDTRRRQLMPVEPVIRYEEEPEHLLKTFTDAVIQSKKCPRAVKVRNERTRALLEECCMQTGILLSLDDHLPALDRAKDEFLSYIGAYDDEMENDETDGGWNSGPGDVVDLFETLMQMSDQDLRTMPRSLVNQLLDLGKAGFLPRELDQRLRRIFR